MKRPVFATRFALLLIAAAGLVLTLSAPLAAQTRRGEGGATLAGRWSGGDWGEVAIGADGIGSYTDTYQTGPGRLRVRRIAERRYEGTWGESDIRYGTLVLVIAPDGMTITGSWTPDPQSTIGSQTGGPIAWTRIAR